MKTLKWGKNLVLWSAVICGNVATAQAAEAVEEVGSDLFVWIFLAFCALIVLAQLIPASMVLLGFAKGFKKQKATAVRADREVTEGQTISLEKEK